MHSSYHTLVPVSFPLSLYEDCVYHRPVQRHTPKPSKPFIGAYRKHGRNLQRPWAAMIRPNRTLKHVGYFRTRDEALEAARLANMQHKEHSMSRAS